MQKVQEMMKLSRRPLSAMACALLPLAMSGCVSSSYMGISFVPGAADPSVQQLARLARLGDKQAQLELGIALEDGSQVPRDLKRAGQLYRMAASDSEGPAWVYVPPVAPGQSGRVMQANSGPVHHGLPQAQARLIELQQREAMQ